MISVWVSIGASLAWGAAFLWGVVFGRSQGAETERWKLGLDRIGAPIGMNGIALVYLPMWVEACDGDIVYVGLDGGHYTLERDSDNKATDVRLRVLRSVDGNEYTQMKDVL